MSRCRWRNWPARREAAGNRRNVFLLGSGIVCRGASTMTDVTATPKYRHMAQTFKKGVSAFDGGDFAQALDRFRAAAELGHPVAPWALGTMFALGLGMPRHDAAVRAWYGCGEDWGHIYANDASRQWCGEGVSIPDDEVVAWLLRAAEHTEAQYQLGRMHANGRGVKKDFGAAMILYRKAAEQGHAGAMRKIAQMYDFGEGVAKSKAEARTWRERADLKDG